MPLRKDVYDLLRLYEGESPWEAVKPTWFEADGVTLRRPKQRLEYRSQVPDELQTAYDIALAEGLLEQHWLSDKVDALVFVTDKGRGAIALHSTDSEILSSRIAVDLARRSLTLNGVEYAVSSERALRWVNLLAEHPGEWISGVDLEKLDPALMTARPDKLKPFLPAEILILIESKPGAGSRLFLGRN